MNSFVLKRLLLYWYRIHSACATSFLTYEIVMFLGLPLEMWVYKQLSEFISAVEVILFEQLLLSFGFWLSSQEGKPGPCDYTYCSPKSSRLSRQGGGTVRSSHRKKLDPVRASTFPSKAREVGSGSGPFSFLATTLHYLLPLLQTHTIIIVLLGSRCSGRQIFKS